MFIRFMEFIVRQKRVVTENKSMMMGMKIEG